MTQQVLWDLPPLGNPDSDGPDGEGRGVVSATTAIGLALHSALGPYCLRNGLRCSAGTHQIAAELVVENLARNRWHLVWGGE